MVFNNQWLAWMALRATDGSVKISDTSSVAGFEEEGSLPPLSNEWATARLNVFVDGTRAAGIAHKKRQVAPPARPNLANAGHAPAKAM
jgi:hypothetical protein